MRTTHQICMRGSLTAIALIGVWNPAWAQDESAGNSIETSGEIVVTARRKAESLQDVPQTVNVVTSEAIANLKLTQFSDLATVVPGLSLTQDGSGTQTASSMRGVTFDARSTAPPTVAMYLNDAPVQSLYLFDSLFDVGQIEVLRGPQGTNRGVSAPSGAITVTTRRADLAEWGGYAQGLVSDREAGNIQGAINVPIVRDVLAVRAAGVADWTEGNGVRSINNLTDPRQRTLAGRASVRFEPNPDVMAEVVYSHIDKRLRGYEQISGPGQATAINPAIQPMQRLAVQDEISDVRVNLDIVTGKLEASLFGHQLSYVGSYQEARTYALNDNDIGNVLPGVALDYLTTSRKDETTQELRVSSEPSPDRPFDYTVGVFYDWANTVATVDNPGPLLPGAFGSPAFGPDLAAFDPRYQIPIMINIPYKARETSIFGSVTLRLGEQTEVTGGLRHIWSKYSSSFGTTLGDGLAAIPPAFVGPGLPSCAAAQLPVTYPGFCDVPVPGAAFPNANFVSKETPTIYNLSVSHRLNEDVMLFAATGTAFRPAISSAAIQGELSGHPDPALNTLTFHPAEHSTNYEAGVKWTLLGGRGRVNATVFHQTFENLTTYVPNVLYLNTATGQPALASMTASVDAKVTGFELEAALGGDQFDLSAQLSYADGKIDDSLVPCNIVEDGAPVFNTAGLISLCPGGSSSRDPKWSATVQGEFRQPISAGKNVFLRALVTYNPDNKNRVQPNFTVDQYALVNLFGGIRSDDGAWEASLYVRNLFGVERTLDRSPVAYDANGSLGLSFPQLIPAGGSGYYATLATPRREFGLSVRYAWGSR